MPRRSDALPPVLRDAGVTPREAEVLDALAGRRSNAEIARHLSISVRTVESHVSSLLAKLHAEDRSALGALARGTVVGPAASGRLPLALLELAERGPFVGRHAEVARLRAAWEEAATGRARTVVVTGQVGVGKSRLVAECAVVVDRAGGAVLLGRCEEEPLVDYQPFIEALAALWPRIPPAARREAHRRLAPELSPLLPPVDPDPWRPPTLASRPTDRLADPRAAPSPPTDPQAARYRLFEAVTRLLVAASREAPILLVVEDLQWADAPTRKLLRHVALRADRSRLLVVATVRAVELSGPVLDLVEAVRRGVGCDVVALEGLSDADTLALVRADHAVARVHDDDGVRRLAARLRRETDGNPLFLTELLRELADDPAPGTGTLTIPPTVRDVVVRGLARLGDATRDVLTAAAVIGRTFRSDLLPAATGRTAEAVEHALDQATRAGLLTPLTDRPGHLAFVHALVRSVVEDEAPPARRAGLHRRVGEALEAEDATAHVAELARHFLAAATPADNQRAVAYAEAAARRSLAALAYERAADLYERALPALDLAPRPDPARRCDLLLAHASAARRGGLHGPATESARQAVGAARDLGDPLRLADAALETAAAAPVWTADPGLAALLRDAAAGLDGDHPDRRARLLARQAQAEYYTAPRERRRDLGAAAIRIARTARDDATLAAVLSARHAALWGPSDAEDRLAAADEIVAVADRLGDPELALQGHAWRLIDLLELGDVAGADLAIVAHARLARSLRQPLAIRDAALWAAMRALFDGRFEDAEREIERALALSRRAHDPDGDLYRWVQRYWLRFERDASEDDLHRLVAAYEELAGRYPHVPAWRAKIALLHARLGDRPAAQAVFRELGGERFSRLPRDAVWLAGLTYLAEVIAFLRDRDQAAIVHDALAPFAERFVVVDRALLCLGAVSRPLGLLADVLDDVEGAVAHLTDAVARLDRVGARPLAARTRVDLAELLTRRTGRSAATRALLDVAGPAAVELGMARLAERVAALRG